MGDKILTKDGDRELLEMAAKAAGISGRYDSWTSSMGVNHGIRLDADKWARPWNALRDDGEALRLAVKLQMFDAGRLIAYRLEETRKDPTKDDCEIFRRAIVRAAAAIGAAK